MDKYWWPWWVGEWSDGKWRIKYSEAICPEGDGTDGYWFRLMLLHFSAMDTSNGQPIDWGWSLISDILSIFCYISTSFGWSSRWRRTISKSLHIYFDKILSAFCPVNQRIYCTHDDKHILDAVSPCTLVIYSPNIVSSYHTNIGPVCPKNILNMRESRYLTILSTISAIIIIFLIIVQPTMVARDGSGYYCEPPITSFIARTRASNHCQTLLIFTDHRHSSAP